MKKKSKDDSKVEPNEEPFAVSDFKLSPGSAPEAEGKVLVEPFTSDDLKNLEPKGGSPVETSP
jgi:hypothetical protein